MAVYCAICFTTKGCAGKNAISDATVNPAQLRNPQNAKQVQLLRSLPNNRMVLLALITNVLGLIHWTQLAASMQPINYTYPEG